MGLKRHGRLYVIEDGLDIVGILRAYERRVGERAWREVGEYRNIVLNGFYNDLFTVLGGTSVTLTVGGLALGYGSNTVARTDSGLSLEWTTTIDTTAVTVAGASAIALTYGLPQALSSGNTFTVSGTSYTVAAAGAAQGATSIPITTTVAAGGIAAGVAVILTSANPTAPQRMAPTLTTPTTTDPPQEVFSFYLPASANTVPINFTEAMLLYQNPSLTPGAAASAMTHVAFAYAKAVNVDLRLDYTLARVLT